MASPDVAGDRLLSVALVVAALSHVAYAFWFRYSSSARLDVPRFAALMVVSCLLAIWLMRASSLRQAASSAGSWLNALLVVAVVTLASALVSGQAAQLLTYGSERSYMSFAIWLTFCLIAFVVTLPAAQPTHRLLITLMVAGALACVVVGLYERVRYDKLSAMLGNGNFLGAVAVTTVPLALLLLVTSRRWLRAIWLLALLGLLAGVVLSRSTTAIAVAVAQGLLVAVFAPSALGATSPVGVRTLKWVAGVLAALIVVTALVSLVVPAALPAGLGETLDSELAGTTLSTRANSWEIAVAIWADRPLLGAGPDGLAWASQQFMTEEFAAQNHPGDTGTVLLMRDPHNLILLAGASIGLIGLLALFWLAWVFGREVVRGYRRARGVQRDAIFLLALASASFVNSMLLVPWSVRYGALPALVFGIAFATSRGRQDEACGRSIDQRYVLPLRVALSLTAAAFAVLGVTAWMGESAIARSSLTFDPVAANAATQSATRWTPLRAAAWGEHMRASSELLMAGALSPEQYRQRYERAPDVLRAYASYKAEVAHTAFAYVNRYGGPGELALFAAKVSDEALEEAPYLPDVVMEAAWTAVYRGDMQRARELLSRAEALGYADGVAKLRSEVSSTSAP